MQWVDFYAIKPRLDEILQDLTTTRVGDAIVTRNFDLTPIMEFLMFLHRQWPSLGLGDILDVYMAGTVVCIPSLIQTLERITNDKPYAIRLDCLGRASQANSLLYAFEATLVIVQPPRDICLPRRSYNEYLHVAVSRQLRDFNGPGPEWMDTVVENFLRDWSTQQTMGSIAALSGFVNYLNGRQCDEAVEKVISYADDRGWLWQSFAQAMQDGPHEWKKHHSPPTLPELLMALWRYTSLGFPSKFSSAASFQADIDNLTQFGTLSFTPSVLALLKFRYLYKSHWPDWKSDPNFPVNSAALHEDGYTQQAIAEARISSLAQLLESCAGPDPFPYKAVETLQCLFFPPMTCAVHESHQIRLATAIRELFASARSADLRTILINEEIFDLYAGQAFRFSDYDRQMAWLDNGAARGIIKLAFTDPPPRTRTRQQTLRASEQY
ncbi:hypothetical protein DFH06DRAFT_1335968 [Mycena polygramma]|nr:hypothetical protein DFH06DRAFT_1335968 [Mycena polygramma]